MEEITYDDVSLQIPSGLKFDYDILAELISPETWNNHLDDDNREQLMFLLPNFPTNEIEEKTHTLEMFFMDMNFRFSTPLRQFHSLLQRGHFNPSVSRDRRKQEKINRKLARHKYCNYLHMALEETIIQRQSFLDLVSKLPPDCNPSLSIKPVLGATSKMCDCEDLQHRTHCRNSVELRAKKRFVRELYSIKAEAGASSKLFDEEIMNDPSLLHGLNKKQRKQLCHLENSLPASILPIKHTNSSGAIAKDAQHIYPANKSLVDLTEVDFNNMRTCHLANQKGRNTLWKVFSDTKLYDVIARVNEGTAGSSVSPSIFRRNNQSIMNSEENKHQRSRTKRDKKNTTTMNGISRDDIDEYCDSNLPVKEEIV